MALLTERRPAHTVAAEPERRLRLVAAALLLFFQSQAAAGLAADVQWHRWIGRDAFLTPPHILIYSGVLLSGLLCLGMVLLETWRYWHHAPGVDRNTTFHVFPRIPILNLFHAPLGFVIAGFGGLTMLMAAPLDTYWHQLYGLEVTLWAPFHVMGLIGAGIVDLGALYAFASELGRARRDGTAGRVFTFGGWAGIVLATLFALGAILRLIRVAFLPALDIFPTTVLGPVEILTSPIALTAGLVLVAVAAATITERPAAAVVLVVMAGIFTAATNAMAPIAVRFVAELQKQEYRFPGQPRVEGTDVLLPLLYVVPALMVAAVMLAAGRGRRWSTSTSALAGAAAAIPMGLLAWWATNAGVQSLRFEAALLPPNLAAPPIPSALAVGLGIATAIPVGALAGYLGAGLGTALRLQRR